MCFTMCSSVSKTSLVFRTTLLCCPHFTDGIIEAHRRSISRVMHLLKGATGMETRTFDSKSNAHSDPPKLPLSSLFSQNIFVAQFLYSSPQSFTLAFLLMSSRLLGITECLKATISRWQDRGTGLQRIHLVGLPSL